mmetsp:Transcript_28046/g.34259  ORF Transcript_28046/g.34259 Transcript_28046/m.34259 type:complete len:408 (+) Transcript_28046:132-1355(+)
MSVSRSPNDVVILTAVRTPLCRARRGALAKIPPSTLLSTVLRGCIPPSIPPSCIEDICVGNVLAPASGYAMARMAQIDAGIPYTTPLQTLNRQCSSGLQAMNVIATAIASGQIKVGIGCGVESMSSHPMNKVTPPDVDWEVMKEDRNEEAMNCLIPMGVTSENVSSKFGFTRSQLDEFATISHQRASLAQQSGKFSEEIIPVEGVTADDGIRAQTTPAILSKLKPVFDPENGSTTAGNSSQMTDGAAAILLTTRAHAQHLQLPILGVYRSFACVGVPPSIMGIGPAVAIPKLLNDAGVNTEDVELYEINEAFASQAKYCIEVLGLDTNKVNVNGGAIALGHPLGCTGARLTVSLLHEMKRRGVHNRGKEGGGTAGRRLGVVSMCIGTGMGAAALLEVEDGPWRQSSL